MGDPKYFALRSIKASTSIVWGDKDRTYRWPQIEQMWQNIPNCQQLAIVPGCAHAVHLEKPQLFNHVIGQLLSSKQ